MAHTKAVDDQLKELAGCPENWDYLSNEEKCDLARRPCKVVADKEEKEESKPAKKSSKKSK